MSVTRLRMDELVNDWVGDAATPFQIGLLGVLDAGPFAASDGTVDLAGMRGALCARARRVPALGRRVIWTGPFEGRPVWADDPAYDPADHVRVSSLPPGVDLAGWAADRIVRPLDRDQPLWRAELVGGAAAHRVGLLVVVHHVLADGLAGLAIAMALLDRSSDVTLATEPTRAVAPLPTHREIRREHLRELAAALPHLVPRVVDGVRRFGRAAGGARAVMAALPDRAPATSLPRDVGRTRRLGVIRRPLPEVRDTAHALGVTVNDVLLAAVAGGLRALLLARGESVDGLVLWTTVPATTGRAGQAMGMLIVGLPVGEPDPLRRVALIRRTTLAGKARLNAGSADVTDLLHLPRPVARLAVQRGRRSGSARLNLSVANVPGPTDPLWLAGARLEHAAPVAPLVPLMGLSVAALSYAGELAVTVNADGSVRDVGALVVGVARSFAELHALAAGHLTMPAPPQDPPDGDRR